MILSTSACWIYWSFRFAVNIRELCDRVRRGELSGGFANIQKLEVAVATWAPFYHVLHIGPAVHVGVTLSIAIQLRSW